jgi:ribosomal protein S18 acetylase RimI-like enzyme
MGKNNFVFRKANIKDLRSILELNLKLFKKEYEEFDKIINLNWTYSDGKKYFRKRITKKDGFSEVIEYKNKIIGYLCGGKRKKLPYWKKAQYAEIESFFLENKFRNKGLGSKLLRDFINWCKEKRINYTFISASAQNLPAMRLYKKFGFYPRDCQLILNLNNI